MGMFYTLTSYKANGIIDEVKIYDYGRSPAQIAWDFNKGKPVGHWRMDEATSGSAVGTDNIKDHSVHENHGSGSGSNIAWTTGQYGGALTFNGSDDVVDCGNDDSLDMGDAITISAWVKPTLSAPRIGLYSHDSELNLYLRNDGDATYSIDNTDPGWAWTDAVLLTKFVSGEWQHYAFTYNTDGTITIYRNGENVYQYAGSGSVGAPAQNVYIGARNNGGSLQNYFNGTIDDVRVYNYARTAQQIMQDYNEGAAAHFGE
jgi:hypothetical protein